MKKWGIGIIVFLIICLIGFQLFSMAFVPVIKRVAEAEVERFCQMIVNHAAFPYQDVSKDLVRVERDDNNQISYIDFDMVYASKIAGSLVIDIENTLLELEVGEYQSQGNSVYDRKLQMISDKKGVIASVPLGAISNNPFVASWGPRVSVRYETVSQVSSNIVKEVKDYGINRMMVGISIVITIEVLIVAPLYKESFTQDITFPLTLEIIEGQVPQWYQN